MTSPTVLVSLLAKSTCTGISSHSSGFYKSHVMEQHSASLMPILSPAMVGILDIPVLDYSLPGPFSGIQTPEISICVSHLIEFLKSHKSR